MNKLFVFPMILVFLSLLESCETAKTPITGAVVLHSDVVAEGSIAPDITFMDMNGKLQQLSSFYRDATMITFVAGNCLQEMNPRVRNLAANLKGNISLVEICSSDPVTEHGAQCRIFREITEFNFISICDSAGITRSLYHVTTPTAVFVINKVGGVKAVGTINELEALSEKANAIANDEEKKREKRYGG